MITDIPCYFQKKKNIFYSRINITAMWQLSRYVYLPMKIINNSLLFKTNLLLCNYIIRLLTFKNFIYTICN